MSVKQEFQNVHFLGEVTFYKPINEFDSKLRNSTTPSVEGAKVYACSGSVVSITNFTNGIKNQTIKLIGDGNTTLVHGASIKTTTGANKLLAADRIYTLTLYNNVWYEE